MDFGGQGGLHRSAEEGSSSPALSSPPRSPDTITPPNVPPPQDPSHDKGFGVFNPTPATAATINATSTQLTVQGQPRKKPGRKPKPKDPNAPAPLPQKPRKRVKTSDPGQAAEAAPASRQPKITDLVGGIQTVSQPAIPTSIPAPNHTVPTVPHSVAPSVTPTPRPASSGQIFDPVRGSTVESPSAHHAPVHAPVSPNHQLVNRASASPSIKSLIDPTPPVPGNAHQTSRLAPPPSVTSAPVSPAPTYKTNPNPNPNPFTGPAGSSLLAQPPTTASPPNHTPMDLDPEPPKPAPNKKPTTDAPSTAPSSAAPTPPPTKGPRTKDTAPPPLPTGSGLLSATPFGPGAAPANGANGNSSEIQGQNIYLTFDLRGKNNTTINFAREVERQYGFAALHPRLAARRERQRQLVALERDLGLGTSGAGDDDMSLDVLSEPGEDSNAEGGDGGSVGTGTGAGTATGNGTGEKKRRRRKKVEDYDRTDDFIDDTELAWEEQALMAKDGFFVYSGPLVTEGEKVAVERADGTVKRGRGRGRGGASRGESSGRGSRGGGRGSRGGATVRKPRVTKADRAMMEQEKIEREKMGATMAAATLAAKPQPPLTFSMGTAT